MLGVDRQIVAAGLALGRNGFDKPAHSARPEPAVGALSYLALVRLRRRVVILASVSSKNLICRRRQMAG
jgi:hypothetical protein